VKRAEARSPTTVTEKNEVMPAERGQGHSSDLAVDAVDREQQCVELRAHLLGRHLLRAQLEGSGSLSRSAAQPRAGAPAPARPRARGGARRGVACLGRLLGGLVDRRADRVAVPHGTAERRAHARGRGRGRAARRRRGRRRASPPCAAMAKQLVHRWHLRS
jgi:hypothetical protein